MSDSEPPSQLRKRPNATRAAADGESSSRPASDATPRSEASKRARARLEAEDAYSPYLDVLRVLTFLLLASCGLSYLVSGGSSWVWGAQSRPDYLKLWWWKQQVYGPPSLTLADLAAFDGSDPTKPIYLSINGSIFDVTAGARMYGPGGSYHALAGVDATRAFVTGCFAEDRTGDLRGVEDMFLPLDPDPSDPASDPDAVAAAAAVDDAARAAERAAALQSVQQTVQHWLDFFRKSPKYRYVGRLVREPGWEGARKPLCKTAAEGRVPRKKAGAEKDSSGP